MSLPAWNDGFWSDWALVVVGAFASYAALRTLRIINTQTGHIEQQVKEMQAGSKQTDKLIEQNALQASAASDAANAALKSAQAVINSERAWVMVQIEWLAGSGSMLNTTLQPDEARHYETHASIRLKCTNEGKTIAWIDQKLACFQILKELPKQPDFSALEMLDCVPEWVRAQGRSELDVTLTAHGEGDFAIPLVWGVVKYRDAFDGKHETTFGFRIRLDRKFERIAGIPEYNKYT
jgi:hypothetical protein